MPAELPRAHRMDFNERISQTILISYGSSSDTRFRFLESQHPPNGPGRGRAPGQSFRMSKNLTEIIKGNCKLKDYIATKTPLENTIAKQQSDTIKKCVKNTYNITNLDDYCDTPTPDNPITMNNLRTAHAWIPNTSGGFACMREDEEFLSATPSACVEVVNKNDELLEGFSEHVYDLTVFEEGLFSSRGSSPCSRD